MKKVISLISVVALFFICSNISAQSIGKLFEKNEADILFGKVKISHTLDGKLVQKILDNPGNVIMFKLTEEGLIVLDKNRNAIYPETAHVNADEIFYVYSQNMLREIFKNSTTAKVEMRETTLTITNDLATLEFAMVCPPLCYFDDPQVVNVK